MNNIRTAFPGLVLAAGLAALCSAATHGAQAAGEVFRPKDGQFSVRFPGKPKENSQNADSALGQLKVYTATFATTEGNVYLVSYTDFPAGTVKPESHAALFDGVREGLKKDGKLVSETELAVGPDKLPGREIVIEKEKGKQHVKFRVVIRGDRLFQVAVVGSGDFVKGKEATAFLDSFDVTK
ncbi:MAG TPA: hypothetical protein VKE74_14410 [Gemmataceae bacterium]|nr:hypothetical protein [Gemmataceae bacterium]